MKPLKHPTHPNVTKPAMRSREEIQRAIDHLKEALTAGYTLDPKKMIHATTATQGLIQALEWVLGSNQFKGFGEMLQGLEQAGPPKKPS